MNRAIDALVLDASVGTQWYLRDEVDARRSAAVLDAFTAGTLRLIAPDHIRYEIASAIRVATRVTPPRLTEQQAQQALATFLRLDVPTINDNALIAAGYAAAGSYGCAFYDGLYVALAQRLGIPAHHR
ncbi:MAG: type II toxin-antitoxin system VapC family toxin [Dehalococcoidia bacterium]